MKAFLKVLIVGFVFISFQCSGTKNSGSDYRINDIWVLEELHNFNFSLDGQRSRPQLEFHLKDSVYLGNTGCNNLRGKFNIGGDKVEFLPAMTTKMACNDNGLENNFLDALTKANRYSIESMKLTLYNKKQVLCVFKKID